MARFDLFVSAGRQDLPLGEALRRRRALPALR
jgi:hypothetical protein